MRKGKTDDSEWTFLTNYAHVLLCLAGDPARRMRDIAADVGITERGVQRIIAELEAAGYIERVRKGRRNFKVTICKCRLYRTSDSYSG